MVQWLDRYQRRRRWLGFPLAVVYKYVDDQGGYLSALITYYAFLSLFPLLLLSSTVLGFVLSGNPDLQQQILDTAVGQIPVIGDQLADPDALSGSGLGLLVGVLGTLYAGLGVGQATQNAMNICWAVPRNERPNPITSRGRSLVLLLTVGLAVLGTTVLSAIATRGSAFGLDVGRDLRIATTALAVLLNVTVFVVTFRVATALALPLRHVLPGALLAAVVWQLLQTFGAAYVSHVVSTATAVNGVFALVLGLVAFIYLEAVAVVMGAEVNVVRARRLYPRALLTPFTDAVELTPADERAYAGYAGAQRHKGFEQVQVRFRKDGGGDGDGDGGGDGGGGATASPPADATDPSDPAPHRAPDPAPDPDPLSPR
ncbi:YihY/virulence factor BrkB family protein [Vallicoccus soli]|uniref:YihY/virulence factor BrkB family protein n=1 Tax=Vallicoccus soli TaxID=2339232 RepID=A0A3A3YXR0_9ACTN|nr:YihY/virulence factor BrkB family protein [Vallicoccus soli]